VTFTQIGRALRGTLVEQLADGKILNGTLVSGGVNENKVEFGVELAAKGAQANVRMTLVFDCLFNQRPVTLTCNYTTEKGERGSAVFEPVAP
jgi:hypothetical protein